jgi:hypothetical protein
MTAGSRTVKIDSWLQALSTVRSPPIILEKYRLTARPSPVLPYLFRVEDLAWEKATNDRPNWTELLTEEQLGRSCR